MMNEAPISFAPAVAQSPIGPCAKHNHRIADANVSRLRAAKSGRGDIGEKHDLFVRQLIWNFRQIRLRIGNEEIFRLRAIDGIAESPSTNRFTAVTVTTLRPLRGEACTTLTAWSNCPNEHAIADVITDQTLAKFLDYSHRLMTNDKPGFHRIFATQNMKIGSADRCQGYANDRFPCPSMWACDFFDTNVVRRVKNRRLHRAVISICAAHIC